MIYLQTNRITKLSELDAADPGLCDHVLLYDTRNTFLPKSLKRNETF